MEIHTIWVYTKAAEAQTCYRLLKRRFSLASAIYHGAKVFEMGAWHLPQYSLFYDFVNLLTTVITVYTKERRSNDRYTLIEQSLNYSNRAFKYSITAVKSCLPLQNIFIITQRHTYFINFSGNYTCAEPLVISLYWL